MAYDNNNSGAVFKNDRKTASNQPDYKGSVTIDGVEYWASGWIKISGPNARNPGSKFLSLAFEPKDGGFSKPDTPKPATPNLDFDDDIPF